ncbi:MAG TPA: hypothetical protein VI759_01990 [Dehalococcoidia bacterium]|nr:hypothetical protein [Dehalococcoidia bacterium]
MAIAVLEAGLFRPVHCLPGQREHALNWERIIPEEGTVVSVSLADGSLELNISPAISAYAHHHGKRISASVYFEIAAKYAEKVDGRIVQRATVVGCKAGDNPQELLLAKYPSLPMSFDRVCAGFREALALGAGLSEFIDHVGEDPTPPQHSR